ncbi:unnamed protein product [Medioppia subpectinata]|uniref:Transcription factor CBF/NF-Y/archaeal histone domain-containing protein n=1 Tax=Medioppia subpectinata TaxID=1979941 RepID=A0A7R9PXV3_9ACAR|nr:unnamed protein product [Medioppia subpectinata]CAG2105436.1 unnamed protein product [Medioppia subpectinata]
MAHSTNIIVDGLPKNLVNNIIESALPKGVFVSEEAMNAIHKSATVFIIQSVANACLSANSDHLTPDMIIAATKAMGFDAFEHPLRQRLNELSQNKTTDDNHISSNDSKRVRK